MATSEFAEGHVVKFLTPPKVAVFCVIDVYCDRSISPNGRAAVLMLLLKWMDAQDTGLPLFTLSDFENALKGIPSTHDGMSVYDAMVERIARIHSMDELYSLISGIDGQFFSAQEPDRSRIRISPTSVTGHFLRRCYVAFKAMEFEQRLDLWASFCDFIGRRVNSNIPDGFPASLEPWNEHTNMIATEDVTRLFESQIQYMQKQGSSLSTEMLDRLEYIIRHAARVPSSVFYIRFLHGWRSGDYQEAFENLHRYFDYAMHNNDKIFYQYALLNLAILQADFSCYSEAVWETIKTARENNDSVCLNFAMSWLYHFQKTHPHHCPPPSNSDDATLQFLKVKAKEAKMLSLQSVVYLSEAKSLLESGGNAALIFESILKSSYINAHANLVESVGAQFLTQSTLWTRLGVSTLGRFYSNIYIEMFKEKTFVEDYVKIMCRVAYALLNLGKYDEAMKTLSEVEHTSARSLRVHHTWVTYNLLFQFKRAIRNERVVEAENLLQRLKLIPDVAEDCSLDIELSRIEFYLRTGRAESALSQTTALLDAAVASNADIYNQLSFMTAYARIMLQIGRPLRGYALLMRCIAIAEKSSLLPTLVDALCYLCEIFNSIKQHQSVLAVLDATLPHIIECENTELLARAYHETAKAIVGASDLLSRPDVDSEVTTKMAHAIRYAKLAYSEYEKLEDVSLMIDLASMLARLYALLGPERAAERDAAAQMVLTLRQLRAESRKASIVS